jgi:hypothetical protein
MCKRKTKHFMKKKYKKELEISFLSEKNNLKLYMSLVLMLSSTFISSAYNLYQQEGKTTLKSGDDNLIAYWSFDAADALTDATGNYTAFYGGNSNWNDAGKVNGAAELGSSGDRWIGLNTHIELSGDFTVAAWMKLNTAVSGDDGLASAQNGSAAIYFPGEYPKFLAGGVHQVESSQHVVADTWTHIALTRENDVLNLYVNGVKTGEGNWSGTWTIGGLARGPYSVGTEGMMDEFRAYSVALTEAEINALPGFGTPTAINSGIENGLSSVSIYPNPVKGQEFFINCPEALKGVQVELFALNGSKVLSRRIESKVVGEQIRVVIDKKLSGAYLVRITCKNKSVVRKIIFN